VFKLINGATSLRREFLEPNPDEESTANVISLRTRFAALAAFQASDLLAFAVQLLNVIVDIIANNPIAQKVVELSSSQPYSLVEHSLYRFVFPPQGV